MVQVSDFPACTRRMLTCHRREGKSLSPNVRTSSLVVEGCTMELSAQKLRVVTVKAGVAVAYRVVSTTWHHVTLEYSGYTNSATFRLSRRWTTQVRLHVTQLCIVRS